MTFQGTDSSGVPSLHSCGTDVFLALGSRYWTALYRYQRQCQWHGLPRSSQPFLRVPEWTLPFLPSSAWPFLSASSRMNALFFPFLFSSNAFTFSFSAASRFFSSLCLSLSLSLSSRYSFCCTRMKLSRSVPLRSSVVPTSFKC